MTKPLANLATRATPWMPVAMVPLALGHAGMSSRFNCLGTMRTALQAVSDRHAAAAGEDIARGFRQALADARGPGSTP